VRRNVKNHIVTAGYLRRFTDSNGLIQRVPRTPSSVGIVKPRRPETVGYRSRFFVDRQIADAAEHMLGQYEHRGLEALKRLPATWPLEDDKRFEDRLDIACLVAIHTVRTPAFRHHVSELQGHNIPEYQLSPEAVEPFLREVTSEAFSVSHMLGMIPKLASLIASAHWSVIQFLEPLLATSDQPVSIVPVLPEGMQAPVSAISAGGYLLAEEYRFPIDPHHLLLFTWANEPDSPDFFQGDHDLAANLNRSVIGGADQEWFHNPVRRPTTLPLSAVPTTNCFPVGRLFLPNYGTEAVLDSQRRTDASSCLDEMIENEITDHFHVARIALAA
jgi:hypothetical protein